MYCTQVNVIYLLYHGQPVVELASFPDLPASFGKLEGLGPRLWMSQARFFSAAGDFRLTLEETKRLRALHIGSR